ALRYKDALDKKEAYRTNLDAIFSSVREGIISVDRDLNVIEVNGAASRTCGLTGQAAGRPFSAPQGHCQVRCLDVLKKTLSTQRLVERERIECRSKDRPLQVVSISASPLMGRMGEFRGAIMVISDESRLVELERDLGKRKELRKIVGNSQKMHEIYSLIENLANINTTVLIAGESGTGKELVAQALYTMSERKTSGPFVVVNCAAIPETLIESELFGHEKGAFTGAFERQTGKFELANNGVILLDEIGDMSLSLQAKLLRVLQESEFYRVGGRGKIKVNVRVIAATNKDLREKVKKGEFREDLFYRLKVIELDIPPLRERKDDIPDLTCHFLKKFNEKFGKNISGCSSDVQKAFMDYNWPGNVRELEHLLERACILCNQSTITTDHLPDEIKPPPQSPPYQGGDKRGGGTVPEHDESELIRSTLEKVRWNKAKAARLLGIDRSTLYRKMEKYGL
ncbi:MAG: sigma 54-interacting transcriptional regulator, partial [Deltaproteobacteria bacterium]